MSDISFPVGCQTIVFGREVTDWERTLDVIHSAGFQGVEIAQRPETLCGGDIQAFRRLLEERDLKLVGLAGGSLRQRMEFLGDDRAPYLYTDEIDEETVSEALHRGFQVAIHPHFFKRIQRLKDLFKALYDRKENPRFLWIIDLAHLAVAGDEPSRGLSRFRDKLVAVHLMDWTPAFGRSSHRYSKGFVPLGEGVIDIDDFLKQLSSPDSNRQPNVRPRVPWLIWELDWSRDPAASTRQAAVWFHGHGLLAQLPGPPTAQADSQATAANDAAIESPKRCHFVEELWSALNKPPEDLYHCLASAMSNFFDARTVAIWAYSPAQDLLSLYALVPRGTELTTTQVKATQTLECSAIERQSIEVFDLRLDAPGASAGYPDRTSDLKELALRNGTPFLIVLPVFHSFNSDHIRFVVQFLMDQEPSPEEFSVYTRAAEDVARIADNWLTDRLLQASAKADILAQQSKSSRELLEKLVVEIRDFLSSDGCTIFLADPADQFLNVHATTGMYWRPDLPEEQRCYARGEGLTGQVFAEQGPRLVRDPKEVKGWVGKSWDIDRADGLALHQTSLLSPIRDTSGRVIGVLRCLWTAHDSPLLPHFSDDDLALTDAMMQVAIPHWVRLEEQDRRRVHEMKLNHELKRPVFFTQLALGRLSKELPAKLRPDASMQDKNLATASDWLRLMTRLLRSQDLILMENYQPHAALVNLGRDVVVPMIENQAVVLEVKGLPMNHIELVGFEDLPNLFLDPDYFSQVFVNLLDNAIKYKDDNSDLGFKVQIAARVDAHRKKVILLFRDWGIGIPLGWQTTIFREGARAPNAERMNVQGNGFGLAIVKKLIAAHEGVIWVSQLREPTEFTITLPLALSKRPPSSMEIADARLDH
jgi:signal transduction histidine kinase/sugar phosphate isomerase/epimerase